MAELLASVVWARPWALALLPVALVPVAAWRMERRRAPRLRLPGASSLARGRPGTAARLAFLPAALLSVALGLVVVALARPQSREPRPVEASTEGIDIVVALDLSTSMRAADFRPRDRLQVAKEVLADFVASRSRDRLGLVVFAADAYTQAPLTRDRDLVRQLVELLEAGTIEDGTAIGDALATALERLRASTARSRVVVLVTDGDDNASRIAPLDAARAAAALGIRVYTILVGRGGLVPYPVDVDAMGRAIYRQVELPVHPELLREVAAITGGAHYDAVDRESLRRGLHDLLDHLERSRLTDPAAAARRAEHGPRLLAVAVALGALSIALGATALRRFP